MITVYGVDGEQAEGRRRGLRDERFCADARCESIGERDCANYCRRILGDPGKKARKGWLVEGVLYAGCIFVECIYVSVCFFVMSYGVGCDRPAY